MSYETLRYVFIGATAFSGVMLIVSVLLFIFLKIPQVIGDLTGATAKKGIESIRAQNEQSGEKTYKTSAVNRARGKLTAKITPSGRLEPQGTGSLGGAMATAKIADSVAPVEGPSAETTALESADENVTTVLAEETTALGNETTVLANTAAPAGNETTVLAKAFSPGEQTEDLGDPPVRSKVFLIERDITFIHTEEAIG